MSEATEWLECDEPCATNPCEACRGRIERVVPPADDLRERRVWTCKIGGRVGRLPAGADAPMRRAVADAFTAETGCPVEFCFSGWGDDLDESEMAVVENREPDPEVIRAALVKRLTTLPGGSTVDTTTPPVPPWPGAVLSGLVDEDGQPTWLALAPNVQGEYVRTCIDFPWFVCGSGNAETLYWVEVRAPRIVPEPETETERVPWWEAPGRTLTTGKHVTYVRRSAEGRIDYTSDGPGGVYWHLRDLAPDGTVEVLKDGGQ